jgi:hypothetical protein
MSKPIAALLTIYVVWGSTYMAIRYALESFPPLGMSGVRFILAGAILFALHLKRVTLKQWGSSALVGLLLLAGGTGGVAWAEQSVSSGQVALLVACVPVWLTLWEWLKPGGKLVYCVCSLEYDEGEGQAKWFLSAHKDATLVAIEEAAEIPAHCITKQGYLRTLPAHLADQLGEALADQSQRLA